MAIRLCGAGGSTAEFTDHGDLVSFVSRGVSRRLFAPSPCWALAPAAPDPGAAVLAPPVGSGEVVRSEAGTLDVVFREVVAPDGATTSVFVRVRWYLEDGLLRGRIRLEGLPEGFVLHALIFPDLQVSVTPEGRLILPRLEGVVIHDAGARIEREGKRAKFAFRYPGQLSMQCLGWAEKGDGLYLDSRDVQGWSKEYRVTGRGAGIAGLQIWHFAPREPLDGRFDLPYGISIGGFDGTWFDVGRVYRRWALQTRYAARGPEERRQTWIADVACWVWNRGRVADVCPPVRELASRLQLPVALDWYWWHKHGYDTEYPDYFPPREGEAALRDAIQDLQARGVYTQVYTNGVGYDMDGKAWLPDGPECAILLENGEIMAVVYNVYTKHRLAHCCGASEIWHRKVRDFVRKARALGIDGLYIDMISNVAGARLCFHPRHGHAPGGGFYQVEGFRRLWRELRREHPGFVFTTEAPAEVFADLVDGFITINTSNERLGDVYDPIQLWNAVYHGRAVCFGNYALPDGIPPYDELWPPEHRRRPEEEKDWRALCPDQFSIELARTLVGGIQPMVANLKMEHFENPEYADDMRFLVDVARFYHAHREWLLWGEMLPPGELDCRACSVRFLQRMIFTPPGREKIIIKSQPAVLHSAWQAPSGQAMLFLVNYTREPQPVRFACARGLRISSPLPEGFRDVSAGEIEGTLPPRGCAAVPLEQGIVGPDVR